MRPFLESTATMSRLAAHGIPQRCQERLVDAGLGERGRSHDHPVRALPDQRLRALDGAHAAAHARDGFRGQHAHDSVVRAAAHGGVEIDHLDFGKGGELAQHLVGGAALEGFLAALDQLHHFAVHQVDAGEDHVALAGRLTGMPRLASSSFNWVTV